MDPTELDNILNIIKKRCKLIKCPVIQFSYSFYPQDFAESLSGIENNKNILIHNEIDNVFHEFQQAWESAKKKLRMYKSKVSNEIISREQILVDVQNFERIVCQEQEKTSRNINALTRLITDENILAIAQQEILKMNKLFDMYFIELKKKIHSLSKQKEAMFFGRVLKEIELNECWLKKAHSRALFLFSKQLLTKISIIVDSINEHLDSLCKDIEKKLSELKTKIIGQQTNPEDSVDDFLRQFDSESTEHLTDISEIKQLQKMESELKERLTLLTDFRSIMNNFAEEKIQLIKKMDEAELNFKNEMENLMEDNSLSKGQKFDILNTLKYQHEKIIFECKEAIKNIEESQANLGQMLLSHERISDKIDKKSIECHRDKLTNIIEEIEYNKAYHRDEQGNYYTFYKDQKIYVNDFSNELFPNADMPKVVISDTQYLKETVGTPLIKGLAQVVLHQPPDPIKYLAHFLLNYRKIMNEGQIKSSEMEELNAERERICMDTGSQYADSAKKDTSPHRMSWRGGKSFVDIDMTRYNTPYYTVEELDGE